MGISEVIKMLVVIGVLLICSYTDIREKKVSIWIIITGVQAVIVLNFITKDITMINALLGGIIGLLLIGVSKLTKNALGLGDAMLIAMIGLALGMFNTLLALFYALLITAVVSAILLVFKRVKKQSQMPFVPFILLGYLGVIFSW
ncbi:MAG: A24 family peptidase [bacterium]|nr:A24 family peptidase [bacterium]